MKEWHPITREDLDALIAEQLRECSPELRSVFERYRVTPFLAPVQRNGAVERVYVVARRGEEVLYYEDVEEGFNFSLVPPKDGALEHWCNQDDLKHALLRWHG